MITDEKLAKLAKLGKAMNHQVERHPAHGSFLDNPPRFVHWCNGSVPITAPTWEHVRRAEDFGTELFNVGVELVAEVIKLRALLASRSCTRPPAGWWCSRGHHEDGPCAARPESDRCLVEAGIGMPRSCIRGTQWCVTEHQR